MAEYPVESSAEVVVDLNEKKPIRVLHIDDELGLLKVAKQCLEMEGQFHVDTASSVDEAIKKMEKETYDVVVSDYHMPVKDGLEFLKELRANGNGIPFIMFTGKGREEVAIQALNLGANQYLNKTGDPGTVYCELAHGIQQAVQRNKAEERIRQSEEKYRNLFELAPDTIMTLSMKGVITSCNNAGLAISGYSRDEIVGKHFSKLDFLQIRDIPRYLTLFASIAMGKIPKPMQVTWHSKDESSFVTEFHVGLIKEGDKTVGIQVIGRDITERKKAELELLELEAKYRTLVEQLPLAIYTISAEDAKITSLNPVFEKITGWKRSDWIGKTFEKLIHPDDLPLALEAFQKATHGETMPPYELRVLSNSGEYLVGEFTSGPQVEKGKIVGKFGIVRDITERKKSEDALKKSEAKYRTLVDQSLQGMVVAQGPVPHIVFANTAMARILGYTPEDLVSLSPQQTEGLVHPEDRELFFGRFKDRLEGRPAQPNYEVRGIRKDGTMVWLELSSTRTEYNDQPAVQATFMDITERKKAEEALRESEEKFRTIFDNVNEVIVHVDAHGKILDVNERSTEIFGYKKDEVVGKNFLRAGFLMLRDIPKIAKIFKDVLISGKDSSVMLLEIKHKNGSRVPVEVSSRLLRKNDKVEGFLCIVRDITERKRAEEERKRYEDKLSALNTYGQNLNMAKSMKEIYCLTLDAMQKVLGFEYADLMMIDRNMLCIVDHRGYPESLTLELPLDGSKRGITTNVAKTGTSALIPDVTSNEDFVQIEGLSDILSELAVPVRVGQKTFGVLNVESKELNAFDEKDQALLEILASHAATAISNLEYAKNLEASAREIRESQQRFERLFMDNPEAAVYMDSDFHILDVNPRFCELFCYSLDEIRGKHIDDVVVPEDNVEEAKMLGREFMKGPVYHDTVRKRKDGSLVPVSISGAPIIVENRLVGSVGLYKDISQLKNIEKKLEAMNEKLRVVGSLTRHDAKNKLSAITGNVYLARKKLAGNDEVLDNLNEMELAVAQMVRIFDFAKTYEMIGVEELRYTDLEKMIAEAVSLFSDLKGVKVINNCRGLTVLADSLLRQFFYNLIDNSLKYGEKLSQITIRYERAEGNQIRLVYEDDGVGIAWDAKPKIFHEGYTTGKGSGYGLYLVKRMMDAYGWDIRETGTPGKGVCFTIVIPETNKDGKENYQLR